VCGGLPHGRSPAQGQEQLSETRADLVAFGRPFITNPDLPERLKSQTRRTI